VFDVVGGDAFSGVTVLVSDPARIVSAVDPGVEEAGGTFLVSTVSGTAPVAELITDGKVDRKICRPSPPFPCAGWRASDGETAMPQDLIGPVVG